MKKLIIFLEIAIFSAGLAVGNESSPRLNLVIMEPGEIPNSIAPVFICDDFALVDKADMPLQWKNYNEIFPDKPGEYYVIRILDLAKLKQIDGRIPYMLIGENCIFRSDSETAEEFAQYGWGMTRLSAKAKFLKPHEQFAPQIVTEYDPDIAAMISNITASSSESTLSDITDFSTRYSYASQCRLAEDYVYNRFGGFSLSSSYFAFNYSGTDMRDVIGEMTGTVAPESVIIICGHLDDRSEDPYNNAPGAEDNGSGSTAVIEAARVLSQYQSELTIRFITFSGEEQGLIGSAEYADSMLALGENIAAVINLDMVAYHGLYPIDMYIYSDSQSHWLGSLAAEVMSTYTSVDTVTFYESSPRYGSDHYSFATRGYPAMFFIDAWSSSPDWYPYYHTTADTMGNLDMNLQASIGQTGAAMAAILARVDLGANPDPIPTLSEWGMLILALLLLAAGTLGILRKRKPYPV